MSSSHSNAALSTLAEHIETVVLSLSDQKHECSLYAASDDGLHMMMACIRLRRC